MSGLSALNLKVLRITSRFHPPHPWLRDPSRSEMMRRFHAIGGMQLQVHLLTEAIAQLGVYQSVITVRPPWAERHEERPNISMHRYGWQLASPRQMYAVPAFGHIMRLRPKSFDLIHCHTAQDLAAIPLALLAAERVQAPLIISLHCSWQYTYIPDTFYGAVRQRIGKWIERQGLRSASAIVVLTSRLASLLTTNAAVTTEKVSVLPDGVDLHFMRSKSSASSIADFLARFDGLGQRPRITFIGRLVPQKGVLHLVEAFSDLRLSGTKASLVIAGDGSQYLEIRRAVTKMGLDESTTFTRFLHHDDIPLLLSETDILVVPSIYEEFGSVLLEGMAAGVPIVASNVDGIPGTIQHERNGLLVRPGQSRELAAALHRLLIERAFAQGLARQAAQDVTQFDIGRIAQTLLNEVYLKCLQPSPVNLKRR